MSSALSALRACALSTALGLLGVACDPFDGPQTGSQTNWLRLCQIEAQCGGLECLCGTCTHACSDDEGCADLEGASCVRSAAAGAIAQCGGREPPSAGLCLPRCKSDECRNGTACVAGACSPLPEPMATVTVDTSTRYQKLVGFGASIGYVNGALVNHPQKEPLLEAMFSGSGLDVLRLQNLHGFAIPNHLADASEIVGAAAESLGRAPTVILTSWSPPAALKANGSTACKGNPDTCTLAKLSDGSFDYAGFADYWRASLDAHAEAGIEPDYIGIQNNPDWVPPASDSNDACRFLPTEGTATVTVGGSDVEVEYPGFAEALEAVVERMAGLASVPKIVAPEVTGTDVGDYAASLDFSSVDAIGHHLYGTDPAAVNVEDLEALAELGQKHERPILQTEMEADGLGTAILLHHTLVTEGASAYLQNVFVALESLSPDPTALIGLDDEDFTLQAPYHAMRHFAFFTDPDWVRVATHTNPAGLLSSAWLSRDGDALTLVLVNAGLTEIAARIEFEQEPPASSEVSRTAFEGVERSAELGALAPEGTLRVPGHSIVTVAMRED